MVKPISITSKQKAFIILGGFIVCMLATVMTVRIGLSLSQDEFQTQAGLIRDELTRRYSTLEAVLTSLAGFHQASDYVSEVQFSTFANELLSAYPYIRTALALRDLKGEDRANLERDKHELGYYQFNVSELTDDSRLVTAGSRNQYLIINVMEPLSPQTGALLGYDIFSNAELANAVDIAINTGKGIASPVTRLLQSNGGVMIFKAVYKGRYTPSKVSDRLSMFDGAIAIEVGIDSLLTGLATGNLPLLISLRQNASSPNQEQQYTVHSLGDNKSSTSDLSLLPLLEHKHTMNLYGQSTELTISHQLTTNSLNFYWIFFAVIISTMVYAAVVSAWRYRILDRIHEEELASYAARAAFSEENTDPILRINYDGIVLYSNDPGIKILKAWNTQTGHLVPDDIHDFIGKVLRSKSHQEIEVTTDNTHYTLRFVASRAHHYVNIYGRDDTEQKQAELHLLEAKQQAEAASIAKSRFMATISHEVRTPLNGVLGMLELLLSTQMDERQRNLTETASRSGKILLGLINDILDFSRLESSKMELDQVAFKLQDVIDEVIQIVAEPARIKRLILSTELPPNDLYLIGDDKRLRQILINLSGNAVKFTEAGEVTIRVSIIAKNNKNIDLSFEVIDTGVGINAEALPTIFDDFTQQDASTTRRFGGTGLGLAITKQLVDLMNGSLSVSSIPNKGSTFCVKLRLRQQNRSHIADEPATYTTRSTNHTVTASAAPAKDGNSLRTRVLLAEDNQINKEVATAMLESIGCDVTVVDDGMLAVEALKNNHYDLVFMDCQMPNMDGFEATRQVRLLPGEYAHVPIIALTANVQANAKKQCKKAGMNDYLSKPFTQDEILDVVKRWSP